MRRALLGVVVLVLALTGCGVPEQGQAEVLDAPVPPTVSPTVGGSLPSATLTPQATVPAPPC